MKRCIFITGVILTLLFGLCSVSAYAAGTGTVSVKGITLKYDSKGDMQGFVDISLADANITGFDLTLDYDKNYLVPSDYRTNEPTQDIYSISQEYSTPFIENISDTDAEHVFDLRLSRVLADSTNIVISPDAKLKANGYISDTHVFLPVSKTIKAISVDDEPLRLISLSFKITNPEEFLKLDETRLKEVLNVVSPANSIYVTDEKLEQYGTMNVAVDLVLDLSELSDTYAVTGTVTGWNPNQPFVLEFYRTDEIETAYAALEEAKNAGTLGALPIQMPTPVYTFKSDDTDEDGNPLYGSAMEQTSYDGQCSWTFSVPVSNKYDYRLVISKMSHLTYSSIPVNHPDTLTKEVSISNPEYPKEPNTPLRMFVGDVNGDEMIYLIDRAYMEHYFNRSIPWDAEDEGFQRADINGDGSVNMVDLDLLKSNYGAVYVFPAA